MSEYRDNVREAFAAGLNAGYLLADNGCDEPDDQKLDVLFQEYLNKTSGESQ